jgi:hypothetical protein
MAGRRSGHLNIYEGLSACKFIVHDHSNNAQVTGSTFGWFVMEYDSVLTKFRVKYLADADDSLTTEVLAQSTEILASTLPASVTLAAVGGSGVSGTITITGVR